MLSVFVLIVLALGCHEEPAPPATREAASPLRLERVEADQEWRSHGGGLANQRFSPLDQIGRENVGALKIAWRWRSPDDPVRERDPYLDHTAFQATPLMIGGSLFLTTAFTRAVALAADTGTLQWLYDPQSHLFPTRVEIGIHSRGVAYWESAEDRRVVFGTTDGYLVAVDARTGRPVATFGDGGRVDLTKRMRREVDRRFYSVSSPPVICRDTIVSGSWVPDMPIVRRAGPGDVRGFDVRTGALRWTFHTVPQEGEVGVDSWENDSWRWVGNTNVWSLSSADESLGFVYLPIGTPTDNFFGGDRLGDNLFGNSLVALDCRTGRLVWHQQLIHHDVWDYDTPAAPTLIDVTVDGRAIRGVAQVTKQGFVFAFDRETGAPIWPIEERAFPQSKLPGERLSVTQPVPTRPPPFERQGVGPEDLIDFTPELRAEAQAIADRYDGDGLYTPPSERGAIHLPGWSGGANWGGAAFDPTTQRLYVASITQPILLRMQRSSLRNWLKNAFGRPEQRIEAAWEIDFVREPTVADGLPILKPPYGRITAYDMNRGDLLWQVPNGIGPVDHPALAHLRLPRLGTPGRTGLLVTNDLIFAGEGASQKVRGGAPFFRAYDKTTGALLWETRLGSHVSGSPMTYQMKGRQFVVVATGGFEEPHELVAFALPAESSN